MAEVKSVSVKISADGYEDAKLKIDRLSVASDELARKHPEITPKIDSAKALIEARLLKEGIKRELGGSVMAGGSGGMFNNLAAKFFGVNGGGGGGAGGVSSLFSGGLMSPAGIAGITAAVGAALPELSALVTGFAAAGAGAAAFGALAIPTFDKIKNAFTSITAAQKTYNDAAALNKEDPTKTHATAAAAALVKLKLAEEQMSPSTRTAVTGIQSLIKTYEQMAAAFAPDAMKVFNSALKIANTLLPDLKPFADAAAGAINGLLVKVNTFFKSADFKKWLGSFQQYVGPSIGAIGTGIGKVATAIGKLLTGMSVKDVVHGITIAFDILSGTISAVTGAVHGLMKAWDYVSQHGPPALATWLTGFAFILSGVQYFTDAVLGSLKTIVDGAAKAFGWIPGIGGKLKTAAKYFDNFVASVHNNLSTAQKNLLQWRDTLNNTPKKFKLEGDITDLLAKLASAKKELKNPDLIRTRQIYVKGVIAQLEAQIAKARADLAALNGTTATTYINTAYNTIGRPTGMPRAHAAGGPASGLSLVGEQGPELVTLPQGSYVHNARQTRGMLGGNQYTININALVASRDTGRQVVEAIRQFEKGSGKSWRAA